VQVPPGTALDEAMDVVPLADVQCRGARPVCGERRINRVLAATRRFPVFAMNGCEAPDNRVPGCGIEGAHIHVIRRANVTGAAHPSRKENA
jgi:hypothetical protein